MLDALDTAVITTFSRVREAVVPGIAMVVTKQILRGIKYTVNHDAGFDADGQDPEQKTTSPNSLVG